MKLIRTFEITQDEFYDYLEEELLKDISKALNRHVKAKELKKGFTYKKKDARSEIVIDEYIRGQIYQATAKSLTDSMRVTYETKPTDKGLEIIFEQYLSNYDPIRNQKNVFARTFNDWINFGRMSNTLYGMRTQIINRRNGIKPVQIKPAEPLKGIRKKIEDKLNEQDA